MNTNIHRPGTFLALFSAAVLVAGLTALVGPSLAWATQTFTVSNTNDGGSGSLRQAIADADAVAGADTIEFSPDLTGTITLTSGELRINSDLVIEGPGVEALSVSGNNQSRVFYIPSGVTAEISGMTITGGRVVGTNGSAGSPVSQGGQGDYARGGGVYNAGVLTLRDVDVAGNTAQGGSGGQGGDGSADQVDFRAAGTGGTGGGGQGGGIYNRWMLTLRDVDVAGNTAQGGSGGQGGDGILYFSGFGTAGGRGGEGGEASGGGIVHDSGGSINLQDSTVSGNVARGGQGGDGGLGGEGGTHCKPFGSGCLGGDGGIGGSGGGGGWARGGGLYLHSGLSTTNSTIDDNDAEGGSGGSAGGGGNATDPAGQGGNGGSGGRGGNAYGGGSFINGSGWLNYLTVSSNSASGGSGGSGGPAGQPDASPGANGPRGSGSGGGLFNQSNNSILGNSIVALNLAQDGGPDISGTFASFGNNLFGDKSGGSGYDVTDKSGDPKLGPLQDNGGNTKTRALRPTSPAINAADAPPQRDQRGITRPQGAGPDIGAFELELAPTVSGPEPNGQGVSTEANVAITFSENMDPNSITEETFTLTEQGSPSSVEAQVSYDGATRKATLDPDLPLELNTSYTALIKSGTTGVKDEAGTPLEQDYSWTFTTVADTTAPITTRTLLPQPNASGWNSSDVTVTLDATDTGGSDVKEIRYSASGAQRIRESVYDPLNPPVINTEGITTISYFATDNAGNQESPAKSFTVKLDKSAPTLDTDNSDGTDGVTPNSGQTGVKRNVKPKATFSDQMDPASLRNSAKLYQWNTVEKVWQQVPARASVVGKTATLDPYPSDPSKLLAANKRFKVAISTGATNLAGIAMTRTKSWTFTTGSS